MNVRTASLKRGIDIVVGTLLAVALLPVMLLLAIGVAVSLRAWPIFVQQRVGRDGRPFTFFKLRTLPAATPRYATKYDLGLDALPWFPRMLRRRHLDELPQLFLVVAGSMSLVGPRPEQPDQAARFDPGFADRRTSARPGCTGLWQISRRSLGLIAESPRHDELYVREASLRLDGWILWRTLCLFASASKMADLDDVPAWALGRPRVEAALALPDSLVA